MEVIINNKELIDNNLNDIVKLTIGRLIDQLTYYTAVQEVEIEEDSAEVLKQNFIPNSFVFSGDLRDCHTVSCSSSISSRSYADR